MDIPIYYDPMIAKLIAWGADREEARHRLIRAIEEYQVKGIRTTLPFGHWALQQPAFINGQFDTNFISKYFTPQSLLTEDQRAVKVAALLAAQVWQQEQLALQQEALSTNSSNGGWKNRQMLR
jgi:acetyl-CoA carboxylase biotin carboxylase subunit